MDTIEGGAGAEEGETPPLGAAGGGRGSGVITEPLEGVDTARLARGAPAFNARQKASPAVSGEAAGAKEEGAGHAPPSAGATRMMMAPEMLTPPVAEMLIVSLTWQATFMRRGEDVGAAAAVEARTNESEEAGAAGVVCTVVETTSGFDCSFITDDRSSTSSSPPLLLLSSSLPPSSSSPGPPSSSSINEDARCCCPSSS